MVATKEWYARVNATWPSEVPVPTPHQATLATKRLLRWGVGPHRWPIKLTTGRNYTWPRRGVMHVNPNRLGREGGGWKSLVHDLSHYMWRRTHPEARPHAKGHAKLEIRMIKQVIKRGWLDPEPVKETPPPPTKRDKQAERYERLKARISSWEAKERRVKNAIKKLRRQVAYYERQLGS